MTDQINPAAAPVNPATATQTANANTPAGQNPNASREAMDKAALASNQDTLRAAREPVTTGEGKQTRSSTLIRNPTNPNDPDVPAKEELPSELPQGTIDEMNAGKKALERNKPVAQALEEARERTDRKVG